MLSFYHLQLIIFNEKGVICVEEEKFQLPVDVRGSKTSVLKLSNIEMSTQADISFSFHIIN